VHPRAVLPDIHLVSTRSKSSAVVGDLACCKCVPQARH
jgi:hypothetical protein